MIISTRQSQAIIKMLPYTYFIVVILLVNNGIWNWVITLPFFLQLFLKIRYVDVLLGLIMFLASFYFFLAYASQFHKTPEESLFSFALIGGLLVVSNFVMSFLLFRNEALRYRPLRK